ncbi:hypothetical protein Tsubulata_024622 [Turnera subulata]|uniref:Uncharacterized protein n=1 Tax=Turnera subulata TaxID=218843 RepID=A0A9Q0J497_9ROSI|nr:hypothetical protein Tsubulata_024622 [Turnera subulata]
MVVAAMSSFPLLIKCFGLEFPWFVLHRDWKLAPIEGGEKVTDDELLSSVIYCPLKEGITSPLICLFSSSIGPPDRNDN